MHAQAWLATALAICVGSSMGIACGSDTTTSGAGGSSGSAGSGASAGAEQGNGGASGAGNGSGSGATGTGNRPAGGGTSGTANGSGATPNGSGGRPPGGSGGRPPGSGGASGGGSSCPPECLVNNTCVTSCGQTPKDYGCCPCPPGTVNARTCGTSNMDAGSSKGVSCSPQMILCRRAPPVCPDGQVPSVEGTCYGPCVPIGDCICQAPGDCPNANDYTCRPQGRCGPPYV